MNYTCFYEALYRPSAQYLHHPVEWYNFNRELLHFNTKTSVWRVLTQSDKLARAGAGAVILPGQLIVINGEVKPGVRTPTVSGYLLLEY